MRFTGGVVASAGGSRHGLVVLVVSAGSVDVVLLPGVDAGRGGFGGRAQRRGDPRNTQKALANFPTSWEFGERGVVAECSYSIMSSASDTSSGSSK